MKLVVFAHTPPPFHGQSFMVKLLLDNLGGDLRRRPREMEARAAPEINAGIQCFHVNARFSADLNEIGSLQVRKFLLLIRYCVEAIGCRFRYRADSLYYVPAPPKRVAFYRDCLVLLICRPFFRRLIFHWQASGLGHWLQCDAFAWEREIGQFLLGRADLSITLASSLSSDAFFLKSKRVCIVPNAVPDPCPTFDESILPLRTARLARRRKIFDEQSVTKDAPEKYHIVFLAHCSREKGLFDALDAIALGNQKLKAQATPLRLHLTVAGAFLLKSEQEEFESWQQRHPGTADYVGFLGEEAKARLLRESDCLCFPTYYPAEAQPVSLVEAMAFGLTIVATAWRGIPELLPPDYPFLIADHEPRGIANALVESMQADLAAELRLRYCESFTAVRYAENLRRALDSLCRAPG